MRAALPALLLAIAAALASCGSNEQATPNACLAGARPYLTALRAAPGAVELRGGDPISACLTPNQGAGDLSSVGHALLVATTGLNAAARRAPQGPAGVQLGYLLGAVNRGASDTGGIHATLVQRLTAAAKFAPGGGPLPAPFERAYARGYAAGRSKG